MFGDFTNQDTPTTLGGRDGRTVGSEDICCGMPDVEPNSGKFNKFTSKGSQPEVPEAIHQ